MTIHQCPKCELRFQWKTELEAHCRDDHPQFHHEYPAAMVVPEPVEPPPPPPPQPTEVRHTHIGAAALGAWLAPVRPREHPEHHHEQHAEGDHQSPSQ